ncbi:MAG: hypothetical protein IJW83_03440 [Clostridia bacterium]|nr:hypothetical protein [Clostridia bacterium]
MKDLSRYEDIVTYDTAPYKKRKRRIGDRKEGRRIRSLPAMNYVIPFIMKRRSDAQNHFEDVVDITNIERYLDAKHKEGYTDMTLLHVVLAAYVRVVCERPGVNRFISGQRIFARKSIECCMDIKKKMTLEGEGTCIKVEFDPRDNVENVYKKFQSVALKAVDEASTDFDKTAKLLTHLPRLIFRGAISFLRFLDYFNLLPRFLLKVSPFHGSMFITHLGSLGIPAIYHHLYDFGNVPVFIAIGSIFSGEYMTPGGEKEKHHFITLKVVTDERICDGYYYASAFKRIKRYLLHPEMLDKIRTDVTEDID